MSRPAVRPRILVVAYDFPPHAAIGTMRTLRVVRQLCARGWEVTVLTGAPETYLSSTPRDEDLLARIPAGVRVIRARAVRPWRGLQAVLRPAHKSRQRPLSGEPATGAARIGHTGFVRPLAAVKDVIDAALAIPDNESGWLMPALTRGALACLRSERPDVIYASSPPWTGQVVAALLKGVLRRPLVSDFRDPWARAPWRGDRYGFALRAARVLERFVVRRADRVVFVAAANRDDFEAQYGSNIGQKFTVAPNGCDPEEFDALADVVVPDHGPFVLLHAGSLYAGRTPVPLLRALARALADGRLEPDGFCLRFLGANALKGVDLAGVCRQLGLARVVEFLPRVPRAEGLRAMKSASSLLVLQPGHTVSVPGKVYEYLASGRPIFAVVEPGETADLVRRGGGIAVAPDDEAAIADALVEAVRRRSAMAAPPPRELFDGNITAGHIVDALERVVAERRGGTLVGTDRVSCE